MVQKNRVDGFTQRCIAPKAEADVGYTAGNMRKRKAPTQLGSGGYEGNGIIVMFADTSSNGENVGVENDVFRRKSELFGQKVVCPAADGDLAFQGVGLSGLIEGHDDHGRAMAANQVGLPEEFGFTFLERYRIDNALALDPFQAGFNH